MANAQPASSAKALFERLTQAAGRNYPNEFEIRRLESDARALLKTEPDKAHQILGAVCALRYDIPGLKRHHEAALAVGTTVWSYRNYSVSLQIVGLFEEAAHYGLIASERQPENLTFLRSAAGYFLWAGDPRKSLELRDKLKQRSPEEPHEPTETLNDLIDLMDRHGIGVDQLKSSLTHGFTFLREKRARHVDCNLIVVSGQEDCAFFQIAIELPANQVQRLDAEFGRLLAENLVDMNSAIVVEFIPAKVPPRVHDGQAARPS